MNYKIKSKETILHHILFSDNVRIGFIKQDGSERTMFCTLKEEKIPKDQLPKQSIMQLFEDSVQTIEEFKSLKIFDLEKMEWRQFVFDRLVWIRVGNIRFDYIKE
jgi:hypothetical protein